LCRCFFDIGVRDLAHEVELGVQVLLMRLSPARASDAPTKPEIASKSCCSWRSSPKLRVRQYSTSHCENECASSSVRHTSM
jgi:hypothetical protein